MRNDFQLIQASLADPADSPSIISMDTSSPDYSIYKVNIPEKFKGLPKDWNFIVLKSRGKDTKDPNDIVMLLHTLINKLIQEKAERLVLISSSDDFKLNDRLPLYPEKNVFYIDYNALSKGKETWPNDAKLTPFIRAIRNRLELKELLNRFYIPYEPKVPAEGWKFFGRKKEIESIRFANSNYFIVGARKIGKTSLLKELYSLFKKDGKDVYFIDVQNCNSAEEVINQIAIKLDARGLYHVRARRDFLGGNYLEGILLNLIQKSKGRGIILLIDELGNVILKGNKDDWKIIGILRKLSHEGNLRIISTGFQEFFLKQFNEFDGPFINFAEVKKLGVLSNDEVKEFLIDPLSLWGRIADEKRTLNTIKQFISTHPLILQYLGRYLFKEIFEKTIGTDDIQIIIEHLIRKNAREKVNEIMRDVFAEPVRELFLNMSSSVVRFLFLKFCDEHKHNLTNSLMVDDWISEKLYLIGFKTTFDQRRFIFQNLELRGLIYKDFFNHLQYRIATPIVYHYLDSYFNITQLIGQYEKSISEGELNKFKNEA